MANRFKDLIEFACQQLCTSTIKPRIKTLMDAYITVNHKISEDEFSQFEANDPFIQNFIVQIDALFVPFKVCFDDEGIREDHGDVLECVESGELRSIDQCIDQ